METSTTRTTNTMFSINENLHMHDLLEKYRDENVKMDNENKYV